MAPVGGPEGINETGQEAVSGFSAAAADEGAHNLSGRKSGGAGGCS